MWGDRAEVRPEHRHHEFGAIGAAVENVESCALDALVLKRERCAGFG